MSERPLTKALSLALEIYWANESPKVDRFATQLLDELKRVDPLLDGDYAETVGADG